MIGNLLKTNVEDAIGLYTYTEKGNNDQDIPRITNNPNESIIYYILHYLQEKLPEYKGKEIIYSWVYPQIDTPQEQSLQTPSVSLRVVSKIRRSLGRYISDRKGNIAKGYQYDAMIEIHVIDTNDFNAKDLGTTIDDLLIDGGTIPKLFDYISKYAYSDEEGFSDTYKLDLTSIFRTSSEQQYVYSSIYSAGYKAETTRDASMVLFKLNKLGVGFGTTQSRRKYITLKFKIV